MLLIFLMVLGVTFLLEDFLVLCEDGGECTAAMVAHS